jgi:hypothetical protein
MNYAMPDAGHFEERGTVYNPLGANYTSHAKRLLAVSTSSLAAALT